MKMPKDIKLKRNSDNTVTTISIEAYGTLDEAREIAENRFKQLLAILSLNLNLNINGRFQGWYKLTPDGIKRTVIIVTSLAVVASVNSGEKATLDIEKQLNITDGKFWRQLAHFHKGRNSLNPVERYREFFQVLEDEGVSIAPEEKALRHAVSHPYLTHPPSVAHVTKILGEPFFDPSNEKHVEIIRKYADKFQNEAQKVLISKTV
jgi:hypothetical protein